MRPSGESAGYTAESVKKVSCSHFILSDLAGLPERNSITAPNTAVRATTAAAVKIFHNRGGRGEAAAALGTDLPDSESRLSLCRSDRISAADW